MKLPLIRTLAVSPTRAPILRYGVALLSAVLALIPTLFLADLAESRLVVFAVAVMVSAWYGGWKPGLAATGLSGFLLLFLHAFRFPEADPEFYPRLGLFLVVGLLASYLSRECRRALQAVGWLHDTQERNERAKRSHSKRRAVKQVKPDTS